MNWGRLVVENHRGRLVPRTLGLWLACGATASTAVLAATGAAGHIGAPGWGALAATLLVFAAGLVDDLVPGGPRGVRNHLRALASGRVTTGLLKAVIVVSAGVIAVALQGKMGTARIAGVVLVAATANVWNGLDVRPGRSLKFALLATPALVGIDLAALPSAPGVAAASALVLWPDLRERAMLGDGGSNLLGFTVGLVLYVLLPGWGVALAAALAVCLNVLADTLTFSRAIEALPPLRWFDRLGRLPAGETGAQGQLPE
jgi:UDP-GlcNAc:undecaprenyl-phosphate/decaprenyl-phosphate GlcNAc-1-phosphate transferase